MAEEVGRESPRAPRSGERVRVKGCEGRKVHRSEAKREQTDQTAIGLKMEKRQKKERKKDGLRVERDILSGAGR